MKQLFTSESVTEGHPDKVCDQISDAVLDSYLTIDPDAHVACETCVTTDNVLVMGEVSSQVKDNVDIESVVRDTIRNIGYNKEEYGFNADSCNVQVLMDKQSEDINMGVNKLVKLDNYISGKEMESIGAGD